MANLSLLFLFDSFIIPAQSFSLLLIKSIIIIIIWKIVSVFLGIKYLNSQTNGPCLFLLKVHALKCHSKLNVPWKNNLISGYFTFHSILPPYKLPTLIQSEGLTLQLPEWTAGKTSVTSDDRGRMKMVWWEKPKGVNTSLWVTHQPWEASRASSHHCYSVRSIFSAGELTSCHRWTCRNVSTLQCSGRQNS